MGLYRSAAAVLTIALCNEAVIAQALTPPLSGETKTAIIDFQEAQSGSRDGFTNASVVMAYKLIVCDGNIHIAYSLDEKSIKVGKYYVVDGKEIRGDYAAPTLSSVEFSGSVTNGPDFLGSFDDKMASKSLGMSCFSGQSQKLAALRDVTKPGATPAEIKSYLAGFRVDSLNRASVLTSSAAADLALKNSSGSERAIAASREYTGPANSGRPARSSTAQEEVATDDKSTKPSEETVDQRAATQAAAANGGFMVCQVLNAYSPPQQISSMDLLTTWVRQTYPSIPSARKWLSYAYASAASAAGLPVRFNTESICVILPSAEAAKTLSSRIAKEVGPTAKLVPWALAANAPAIPVSVTLVP